MTLKYEVFNYMNCILQNYVMLLTKIEMLGIEPRTSDVQKMCSTTELHPPSNIKDEASMSILDLISFWK